MIEQDYLKLWQQVTSKPMTTREVEFAALVAAHEREQCAKVCESMEYEFKAGYECAAAIRARD